jgi:hypothetical protein
MLTQIRVEGKEDAFNAISKLKSYINGEWLSLKLIPSFHPTLAYTNQRNAMSRNSDWSRLRYECQ